jgi:guanine deaminase
MSVNQEEFMRQAIALANENIKSGNGGPFAAIIVKNNRVVATGVNSVTTSNDPTAHAEVNAIRNACKKLKTFQLFECDIYSTCEPCPMCLGAIYWSRAKNLYFAADKKDAASAGFDDSFIYDEVGLEIHKRKLHTKILKLENRLEPFDNWKLLSDKTDY